MSRADEFLARVDAYLPRLNRIEARQFLVGQACRVEGYYQRFVASEGDSMPGFQAADFLEVITGLHARHGRA